MLPTHGIGIMHITYRDGVVPDAQLSEVLLMQEPSEQPAHSTQCPVILDCSSEVSVHAIGVLDEQRFDRT